MADQSNPNQSLTGAPEHLPSGTNNPDNQNHNHYEQSKAPVTALYQSERLSACAKRLIHSFTGKPLSLGGSGLVNLAARIENRQQLCRSLDLPVNWINLPDQVHSATSKYDIDPDKTACDAIIVTQRNHPVMVLTADCVPVIAYDPTKHVGAVIHAGWRGTAQSITPLTIKRMMKEQGCQPKDIVVAIGPSIAGCCYEVSQEVVTALEKTVSKDRKPSWYFPQEGKNPKVDLKTVNKLQAEDIGIKQFDILPNCTFCEPDSFFSHRRGEEGRQGTLLMLL
jgi:YfiH family protein